MISAGYAKTYDRAEATTLYTRAITMEDMPITRGEGHVPLATLKVQGTLTDASPSEPPRYARSDDMLMPDRLLRFDKQYSHDCMQVCATLCGDEQELEDFRAEPTCAAAQGRPEG